MKKTVFGWLQEGDCAACQDVSELCSLRVQDEFESRQVALNMVPTIGFSEMEQTVDLSAACSWKYKCIKTRVVLIQVTSVNSTHFFLI